MIALRRAPGAQRKPDRPPRVRRRRVRTAVRAFRDRLTRPTRVPSPVSMRKRELVVVTTVAVLAVLAVTGIAAVISYSHMKDWALANHEPQWRAQLFPLSVDGAILAASLVLYADSRAGRRADKLAYLITFSGIGWSIGANIGHTWVSSFAAKLIAGWPPVAMALSVELLFRFVRRWRGQADAEVRKAARRAERQAPVPASPVIDAPPVAQDVPAPRPEPEPKPSDRPLWLPSQANAKQACLAYLGEHPNADAIEVDREVGQYVPMSDGYARRIVREFKESLARATEG